MKTRNLYRWLWALALLWGFAAQGAAQQMKIVSGKVLNKPEGQPAARFPAGETITIYAFNTVATAKDAIKQLETGGNIQLLYDAVTTAESDGYYEIRVSETGAIVYRLSMKNEIREVNYKSTIDVYTDGGIVLKTVTVTGESSTINIPSDPPEELGNLIILNKPIPITKNFLEANRRVIVQPYLLDGANDKRLKNLTAHVKDGAEYGLTQERRMTFDMKKDKLTSYIDSTNFGNEQIFIQITDTVNKPTQHGTYPIHAKILIADYTHAVYEQQIVLSDGRARKPLQFLEYNFPNFSLDPNEYKERPRRERRNTAGNISLTFLVNKAEFDPNDTTNTIQMAKLQADLDGIIQDESTTLKEFHITGISSPEGRYDANLALAKRRTQFAMNEIKKDIPSGIWSRVYSTQNTRVAEWTELADILEQDSLNAEAAEVRGIAEKFKNRDAQYAAVARLPYYNTVIKERLGKLRTVKYEYKHEIFRELNPEEILDRYLNDPDYRDGKKQFTRYEYWHLFQLIKEPQEAEKIFRRAYNETMAYNEQGEKVPWILAANNLAEALLRRDTFDLSVLDPLIDLRFKVNHTLSFTDNGVVTETMVNPENIVANQLAMYILAFDYPKANYLAKMLPDTDKFELVKAFTRCMNGEYKYRNSGLDDQKKAEYRNNYDLVKNSSPRNRVVMCMALNTVESNREARAELEKLPPTPLTKYLKLILDIRENDLSDPRFADWNQLNTACKTLDEIIQEDKEFINIAQGDGEISTEFMKYFEDEEWKF